MVVLEPRPVFNGCVSDPQVHYYLKVSVLDFPVQVRVPVNAVLEPSGTGVTYAGEHLIAWELEISYVASLEDEEFEFSVRELSLLKDVAKTRVSVEYAKEFFPFEADATYVNEEIL